MTLRETQKNQLILDYKNAPKKFWNQNNLELKWSDKEKLYKGIDKKGVEWISALQRTRVPIFTFLCSNLVRKGNIEVECKSVNFASITHEGTLKCRICGKTFTPKLNIPKTSKAYKIFNKLDK